MRFLFSYGTLQHEDVQIATFGRRLNGRSDELSGFKKSIVGGAHANLTFTGHHLDRVDGSLFEVGDEDLARADAFEQQFDYRREEVTLASGQRAWVYVYRPELSGRSD